LLLGLQATGADTSAAVKEVLESAPCAFAIWTTTPWTIPANLAGIPGISLPCGTTDNDLPIGLQMLGPQLSDAHLLQYAHGLQQSAD